MFVVWLWMRLTIKMAVVQIENHFFLINIIKLQKITNNLMFNSLFKLNIFQPVKKKNFNTQLFLTHKEKVHSFKTFFFQKTRLELKLPVETLKFTTNNRLLQYRYNRKLNFTKFNIILEQKSKVFLKKLKMVWYFHFSAKSYWWVDFKKLNKHCYVLNSNYLLLNISKLNLYNNLIRYLYVLLYNNVFYIRYKLVWRWVEPEDGSKPGWKLVPVPRKFDDKSMFLKFKPFRVKFGQFDFQNTVLPKIKQQQIPFFNFIYKKDLYFKKNRKQFFFQILFKGSHIQNMWWNFVRVFLKKHIILKKYIYWFYLFKKKKFSLQKLIELLANKLEKLEKLK